MRSARWHWLRWRVDPWYRRRVKAFNRTFKYGYGRIEFTGPSQHRGDQ